jgi:Na+-transporting NADH:ubiquinone oxidoreductase subunit NqrC
MFNFITPTVVVLVLLCAVIVATAFLVRELHSQFNMKLDTIEHQLLDVRKATAGNLAVLTSLVNTYNKDTQERLGNLAGAAMTSRSLEQACKTNTDQILDLLSRAEERAQLRPALAPMLLDLDAKIDHTIQRVEHGITVSANTQVMGGSAKGEFSRALTIIADKLGVDVSGKPVPAKCCYD